MNLVGGDRIILVCVLLLQLHNKLEHLRSSRFEGLVLWKCLQGASLPLTTCLLEET